VCLNGKIRKLSLIVRLTHADNGRSISLEQDRAWGPVAALPEITTDHHRFHEPVAQEEEFSSWPARFRFS
ncbi:MAG: hypothetical protein VB855_01245, partial [Pirellulaceae bacterium]